MSQVLKAAVIAGALTTVGLAIVQTKRRRDSAFPSSSAISPSSLETKQQSSCMLLTEVLNHLEDFASDEIAGASEALDFLQTHLDLFSEVWAPYNLHNGCRLPETASAFNDFYKWTMFPVIRAVETFMGSPVRVTFTVNIRDARCSSLLVTDSALQEVLFEALSGLTRRPFDRNVFEAVINDLHLPWSVADVDATCGPSDQPRMLAQRVSRNPDDFDADGEVVIRMYTAPDNKSKGEARLYVEATGPWHRVTWLETTLMQCVYSTLFMHSIKQKGSSFSLELARACCRAMRSVQATNSHHLIPSLFVGRRTMGMPLMLFQTVVCAERLTNCLGTSSVHAHYILKKFPFASNLAVVGTHAHELSMVLMALFGELDDGCGGPVSQGVGHALYYYLLKPSPLPMLPDTLGTESFLRMAALLPLAVTPSPVTVYLKDVIGIARQDSGELKDFLKVLHKYGFNCKVMASEIESVTNLEEAQALGYHSIGAGGFYGDSKKAWKEGDNISMAVKVTEVFVGGVRTSAQPIKLGDAFTLDEQGNKVFSKLEIDGKLPVETIKQQKERAVNLATNAPSNVERATNLIRDILTSVEYTPVPQAAVLVRQHSQKGF